MQTSSPALHRQCFQSLSNLLKSHNWFLVESSIQTWIYWIKKYYIHHPKKMCLFLGNLLSNIPPNSLRPFTISVLLSLKPSCGLLLLGLHFCTTIQQTDISPALSGYMQRSTSLKWWTDTGLDKGTEAHTENSPSFVVVSIHFHTVLALLIHRCPNDLLE